MAPLLIDNVKTGTTPTIQVNILCHYELYSTFLNFLNKEQIINQYIEGEGSEPHAKATKLVRQKKFSTGSFRVSPLDTNI